MTEPFVALGCLCDERCVDGRNPCWERKRVLKRKEKLWIFALRHATCCETGKRCELGNTCREAKRICAHMRECSGDCDVPLCAYSREIIEAAGKQK